MFRHLVATSVGEGPLYGENQENRLGRPPTSSEHAPIYSCETKRSLPSSPLACGFGRFVCRRYCMRRFCPLFRDSRAWTTFPNSAGCCPSAREQKLQHKRQRQQRQRKQLRWQKVYLVSQAKHHRRPREKKQREWQAPLPQALLLTERLALVVLALEKAAWPRVAVTRKPAAAAASAGRHSLGGVFTAMPTVVEVAMASKQPWEKVAALLRRVNVFLKTFHRLAKGPG